MPDDSSYHGPTYQLTLEHTLSPRTSQSLQVGQSVGLGFEDNYTKTTDIQYGISTRLTKAITLNAIIAYEDLVGSGLFSDHAHRYLLYLGTGYQFTKYWSAGVSYSFGLRESQLPGWGYTQNRLTVDLMRRF